MTRRFLAIGTLFFISSSSIYGFSWDDIKSGVKKFGSDIEKEGKKVGSDIAQGSKKLGSDIEKEGKQAVDFIKEKAIDPLSEGTQKLEPWVLPDSNKRFDEVTYLGAHNAHANFEDGFVIYSQQLWSIKKQLEKGVRHFLLDVWPYEGQLLMCHGGCGAKERVGMRAGSQFRTFKSALDTIKAFLDKNPQEIVSLELENYATAKQTRQVIESVDGLSKYLLTQNNYDPRNNDNRWPRLRELQANNRRLIIFDEPEENHEGNLDAYGYSTNKYMRRNMYGTLNMDKACVIRGASNSNQRLNQLNFFGTVTSPLAKNNTPTTLKALWNKCRSKGIFDTDRPNFLAIDFVDRGNPMHWVNELNRK